MAGVRVKNTDTSCPYLGVCENVVKTNLPTNLWISARNLWITESGCGKLLTCSIIGYSHTPHIWGVFCKTRRKYRKPFSSQKYVWKTSLLLSNCFPQAVKTEPPNKTPDMPLLTVSKPRYGGYEDLSTYPQSLLILLNRYLIKTNMLCILKTTQYTTRLWIYHAHPQNGCLNQPVKSCTIFL